MTKNNRFHYDYYYYYYDYYEYCDGLLTTFCQIIKNEKHTTKNKTNKTKKKSGITYCLGCNHSFRPQQVNMANEIFREKSNCMVCRSNKSRLLKQKRDNKK